MTHTNGKINKWLTIGTNKFRDLGFRVQPSRRPKKRPVKSKKKLQPDKCRMSIDECRIKEFFLFYLLKKAEQSDIHNSSIVNHHSSFHEVSYKRFTVQGYFSLANIARRIARRMYGGMKPRMAARARPA